MVSLTIQEILTVCANHNVTFRSLQKHGEEFLATGFSGKRYISGGHRKPNAAIAFMILQKYFPSSYYYKPEWKK
jgi:hypothetical protein